jgi:hypothetical protein
MEYYYLEKKPFSIHSAGFNKDSKKCKLLVSEGKLHFLDPTNLNKSYIDVEGAEKDILESNLTILEVTEKTNKIFVKINHNNRTIYEDLTEPEKEHYKQGFLNKKMGTGDYTSNKAMVTVLNAKVYADSEVPEYNESETCIELAEIIFSSDYVDINQKLKSDIFFYPTFIGDDSNFSSEESSDESDSSDYSSYESSDDSSEDSQDSQDQSSDYYLSSYDSSDYDPSYYTSEYTSDYASDFASDYNSDYNSDYTSDFASDSSFDITGSGGGISGSGIDISGSSSSSSSLIP